MSPTSPSLDDLRRHALEIFRAGVAAADPAAAVRKALRVEKNELGVVLDPRRPDSEIRREDWERVHVLAFGKAACSMADAVAEILPPELFSGPGLVITNYPNARDLARFETLGSGHPLPDINGVAAAERAAAMAEGLGLDELLLVLISGGGSAILPSPAKGVTLNDKIRTTDLLLDCGADIGELNTVRKHLSRLKGGGLAHLAVPAAVHALILSDVIGDDLSTIASGPTVPDPTNFSDALAVLERRHIVDDVPSAVRDRLRAGARGEIPDTPKPADPCFEHTGVSLIGTNHMSLEASLQRARKTCPGFDVDVYSRELCGVAREEAVRLARELRDRVENGHVGPIVLLAGGETTVHVTGDGRGGRNQEFALAFALAAEGEKLTDGWVLLSGGTDGADGPTDAAGGCVDPLSLERMRGAGVDPEETLGNNDSYRALEASGDLVKTGATGTNVADLQVLIYVP